MKVSMPVTLFEIRLTLSLHASSEASLPLSLYNLWSHLLPLYVMISSEVQSPMNSPGKVDPPYWIVMVVSLSTLAPFELVLGGASCLTTGGAIFSSS